MYNSHFMYNILTIPMTYIPFKIDYVSTQEMQIENVCICLEGNTKRASAVNYDHVALALSARQKNEIYFTFGLVE